MANAPIRELIKVRLQEKKRALHDRLVLIGEVEKNIAFVRGGKSNTQRFRNIQRLDIPLKDLRIAWYRGVQSDYEAIPAINALAENGDPLARELVREFTVEYEGQTFIDRLVKSTETSHVVQGLIFRRLTEDQYWDYTTGKEPVGHYYDGHPIHLRGTREDV
jgi:hypothetical protein